MPGNIMASGWLFGGKSDEPGKPEERFAEYQPSSLAEPSLKLIILFEHFHNHEYQLRRSPKAGVQR